jgi:proteasome lid subunit RPN8/RPN11
MIYCEPKLLDKLTRCLSGTKTEQVAALIGNKDGDDFFVVDVLPGKNEDEDPSEKFYISRVQLEKMTAEALRQGYSLLGIAHSHLPHHPSNPSLADIRYCRHMVNAVYHPTSRSLTWFNNHGAISCQSITPRPRMIPGMQRLFASV